MRRSRLNAQATSACAFGTHLRCSFASFAMALQQALKRPGIVQQIDAMNELFEGVPASEENLKTLLEHLDKTEGVFMGTRDGPIMMIGVAHVRQGRKNFSQVYVHLEGPQQRPPVGLIYRDVLYKEFFKYGTDGLPKAIVTGKRKLKDYRERGTCSDCESAERPRKRLKAERMPVCAECAIKKALQF